VLAANRVERTTGARGGRYPSLLTGMVFDEAGERLTPTDAVKNAAFAHKGGTPIRGCSASGRPFDSVAAQWLA
jgi:hypothetical protein